MAVRCQLSAVAAVTMIVLVIAAAVATLTSLITAHPPPTPGPGEEQGLINMGEEYGMEGPGPGWSSPITPTSTTAAPLDGKNCYRKCVAGDIRVCRFHFDVHPYQTMSRACYGCPLNGTDCIRPECVVGDGVPRRVLLVNKQLPGPPIQVCQGDRVVVDVKNSLFSEGLTMHWHGLTMQAPPAPHPHQQSTPYMDGTPGITQCPIHPGSTFRYNFIATEAGTHYWHSHTGFQRGDGLFGALVVRQPAAQDPNYDQYDADLPEHTIFVHDWLHRNTEDKFILRHHSGGDDFPPSMLVNGQGPHQHANSSSPTAIVPYTRFTVSPGRRYRLRLVNSAILNCPIVVAIDQHNLTVIASDGQPIKPLNASSLVIYPGERWDVVVRAAPNKSGTYWMSFMGGVDCAVTAAHQFALLQYEGPHTQDPDHSLLPTMPAKPHFTEVPPPGIQVNSINSDCYEDLVCVGDLRSPHPLPQALAAPPNHTLYLAFEMRRVHNTHYYSRGFYDFSLMNEEQQIPSPQINNLSFVHPSVPLLLSGGKYGQRVCSAEDPPPTHSCNTHYCECLHMYSIPLGDVVELVLIDEGQYGDENHPVHLHGQYFWVLGQDRPIDMPDASLTRAQVIEMDRQGKLVRNLQNPVYKDTVTLPDAGYTVVRFQATNPGYWLLHCHLLFHSVAGMEIVFKLGEDSDMPAPPPGFPTCGDFHGSEL